VILAANPGDVIDRRYTIVQLIGRGAMADVFEARDAAGMRYALKILRGSLAREPEARARFARESEVQRRLRHPNIAVLYGAGTTELGNPFLVMEMLHGRSLAHLLKKEKRVHVARAQNFMWQALQGLAACHAAGVLHRDLKPGNLMLEPAWGGIERVVLIDFGFAALEGSAGITRQGFVVGSLSYIAPERLRGEDTVDARADLYSLGIVFYELVTGRCPFVADDDAAMIGKHLDEAPAPPSQVAPDAGIPPAIEAVILRALAKRPADRAATAEAMADELRAAMGF
jgi:serine/threonine-protein kinase